MIWAGSDDGLVHVTRNGGREWKNVTPPDVQPFTRINIIDASPHDPGTAYVAANRYQLDDVQPVHLQDDGLRPLMAAHRRRPARARLRPDGP